MKPTSKTRLPRFACAVLFTAAAAWSARADFPSLVLSHNPIAYWQLNETAPASPPLNTLTNYGSLGATGNGIAVRQVTKGQPGKVGNAISLYNGGSAIACYSKVDVPYSAALNPKPPFSAEFWAYPTRNDQTLCAISSMDCQLNGGGSRQGWLVYENGNANWQFRLGLIAGYAVILGSSTPPAVGAWQHIVVTFDGSTAKIYVNGVLNGSAAVGAGWTPNTEMPLMMGCLPLVGGGADTVDGPAVSFGGLAGYRGFDGSLDEVAIYSSLLSASTIKAHYDAATTNTAGYHAQILADNPVGYWTCEDPAVTPPNPGTFPIAVNSGSLGSVVNGTNM